MDKHYSFVNRLQDVGRAEQQLMDMVESDLFEGISKHNPYWDTADVDKMDDVRRKLVAIHEKLWAVIEQLRNDE